MDGKIDLVGVGPGDPRWLTQAAVRIIEASDLLIGGARNLEPFQYLHKATLTIGNNLEAVCQTIAADCRSQKITVLASGDPGLFSICQTLKRNLPGLTIAVAPGISSLQYFCNKLGIAWDDLQIVSLHGRGQLNLAAEIRQHQRVCVFTDAQHPPQAICRELQTYGLPEVRVSVGENLSYPEEQLVTGTLAEMIQSKFGGLCLMLLEKQASGTERWPYLTPGIPDADFIRDAAPMTPMTKEEARAVTLAKLRLRRDSTVFDIGAGTGSVSVECALLAPAGQVYAIERNPAALKLLAANRERFGAANLTIVPGIAPEILTQLPLPDRVFIGGTGGNLQPMIEWLSGLPTKPRIVLNAVTLETTYLAMEAFKSAGFSAIELIQLAVARSETVAGKHLLKALNPIYIISAAKGVTL
jgi:precorrin-6Y C5,15-methyltransferase (decarboxylating)